MADIYKRPVDGTVIMATVHPDRRVDFKVLYGEPLSSGLNLGCLEAFWTKISTQPALESTRPGAEVKLMPVYNKLEQARDILRNLRLSHPDATLPGGGYAVSGRRLDRVCRFLETELEGAMRDCVVDPSAGAAKSDERADGT